MSQDLPPVEVLINNLAMGGEGLGRLPDGRAVFIAFTLPGERVLAAPYEEKRGYVRARLVEVLEASPDRITPRCVHYGTCGGCHFQHMNYAAQLQAKQRILADQLARIGGIEHPPVNATIPSPSEWYYRNHVQFHLDPEGKLGYYTRDSSRVFALHECHLPEPLLNSTWPQLDFEPTPDLERIGLRLGVEDDVMLILEGTQAPDLSLDLPLSAAYLGPNGLTVLVGDDNLAMEVGGRLFRVSAGSFFQVNTPMAEALVMFLLRHLPLSQMSTILDVYCGVGLFSAFLAPRAGQLVGIEQSESACADFSVNLEQFDNVSLYQGAAEQILPALDIHPDIAVVDPPRAGLDRRALDALVNLRPPVLAYVSCDPATLARDARRLLSAGYQLQSSTPFDLFPQSYHIESVSIFSA
ncbi:MAG TPA: class I SAM-dependent RNA methyltransferase [Anaerolineaceae bacterium]